MAAMAAGSAAFDDSYWEQYSDEGAPEPQELTAKLEAEAPGCQSPDGGRERLRSEEDDHWARQSTAASAADLVLADGTPTDAAQAQPKMVRAGSASFWEATAWDPDSRVYVGAAGGQQLHREALAAEGKLKADQAPAAPQLEAVEDAIDDEVYWGAAQWDADIRVYVGADNGQQHHRLAVLPSDPGAGAAAAATAPAAPAPKVAPKTTALASASAPASASAGPAAADDDYWGSTEWAS